MTEKFVCSRHSQPRCSTACRAPAAASGRSTLLIRLAARTGAALLALAASGAFASAAAHEHSMNDAAHEHSMDAATHEHSMDAATHEHCANAADHEHSANAADHEHSAAAHAASDAVRSIREYAVPAVRLVRDDGKDVSLPDEMNDGRPVVLNFIFTTCTSICPMMSSVFSGFEHRLGADAGKVHLMSISIDPEEDTPARLVEYAHKFHAGREWQHYTGTRDASIAAQRAFDVYRGGKMNHNAVTLMRAAPGMPWLRIEGFATPDDLVRDYRQLVAAR